MFPGIILWLLCGLIVGGGAFAFWNWQQKKAQEKEASWKIAEAKKEAQWIISDAEAKSKEVVTEANTRSKEVISDAKKLAEEERSRIAEREGSLIETEKRLEKKEEKIDTKLDDLVSKTELLDEQKKELVTSQEWLEKKQGELWEKLSKMANMSETEARDQLMTQVEGKYEVDIIGRMEKKKKELESRQEEVCREILVNAMQQYTASVVSETTQTTIELDDDEIKGRIIGKEGRNIISFERETGVSIIIDDTPGTVFISSFDLFRRYIAKKSLEHLITDKRIQPSRIEEVVAQHRQDADKLIRKLGEQVLTEMGISGWPDEVMALIGKLRFRTSYGQNILKHSMEVAYIAEGIAKQIGADSNIALQWGILHDIGKALDHDVEGTHPDIGGKVLRKHGFDERLINITEGHHGDVEATCLETKIIMLADAISAVRPWARRASVEQYLKRLREMEDLVNGFKWVDKAYALSAGREVRVFVNTDKVSDLEAHKMAEDIARDIQEKLAYPGEVKVLVIRENRFIEYAR